MVALVDVDVVVDAQKAETVLVGVVLHTQAQPSLQLQNKGHA